MPSIVRQDLSGQVTDELRKAIVLGDLKPGEELRQGDLATRYGVSRIPVRAALQTLVRDGLATQSANNRVVVSSLTQDDMLDHYRARALVEGELAALAATHGDGDALIDAMEATEKAGATNDRDAFLKANRSFHSTLWALGGNRWLKSMAEQLWTAISPYSPSLMPIDVKTSLAEHKSIVTAIQAGAESDARNEMRHHIMRSATEIEVRRAEPHWAAGRGSQETVCPSAPKYGRCECF